MKIEPRDGILLIKKHTKTKVRVDMAIDDSDEEKSLITGEVLDGTRKGQTVIFGKYALFELVIQGQKFYFLPEEDVIGVTDYLEN
jgi:co-chaperonin GroES (HSP10)